MIFFKNNYRVLYNTKPSYTLDQPINRGIRPIKDPYHTPQPNPTTSKKISLKNPPMNRINSFLSNTCKKKQKLIHHNNKLHKIHQSDIKIIKQFGTTKCATKLEFTKMHKINNQELPQLNYKKTKIKNRNEPNTTLQPEKEEYLIPKKFHERIEKWRGDIKPTVLEVNMNIPECENTIPIFRDGDLRSLEEVLKKDFKKQKGAKSLDLKTLIIPYLLIDKATVNLNRFIESEEANKSLNEFTIEGYNYEFRDLQPVYFNNKVTKQPKLKEILLKDHENCCNLPEKVLKLNFTEKPLKVTQNKHFMAAIFLKKVQIYKFTFTESEVIEKTGLIEKAKELNKEIFKDNEHLEFTERIDKFKEENQFVKKRVLKSISNKLVYKIEGKYFKGEFINNKLFLLKKRGEKIKMEKYI